MPAPVPLAPELTVMNAACEVAVHGQFGPADIESCAEPPVEITATDVGDTEWEQLPPLVPAWLMAAAGGVTVPGSIGSSVTRPVRAAPSFRMTTYASVIGPAPVHSRTDDPRV